MYTIKYQNVFFFEIDYDMTKDVMGIYTRENKKEEERRLRDGSIHIIFYSYYTVTNSVSTI